jgi:photosystem II stability/assembly factor-like uncharacterized protein
MTRLAPSGVRVGIASARMSPSSLFLAVSLALSGSPVAAQVTKPGAHAVGARSPAQTARAGKQAAQTQANAPALTSDLLKPLAPRSIGPANQAGRVTAIAVPDTAGHRTIYVGYATGGVWKTTDAGITWAPVFDHEDFASVGDIEVAPSDSRVVWVGTGERNSLRSQGWGGGVYRSTDGGHSWKRMGLEQTREIGRIAIDPRNADVVYVAALGHLWGPNPERGLYKTTDGGKTWQRVLAVDDTTGLIDVKLEPGDPDVVYAASWHRLRWGGGHMEGAGAGSAIWKSMDAGKTWKRLTDPKLSNGLPSERLGRIGLGVTAAAPKVVYAVIQAATSSHTPAFSEHGGLFRSNDAGESWTRVNDLSAIPDYYYNEVWTDPSNADRVWFNASQLGYSDDGGRSLTTWRLRRVHVDNHALWVDPSDPQHLLLGNDGGLYTSFDGGKHWHHFTMPVGQFYEASVDSSKVPYYVCGGLQDNGIWCGPTRTREDVGITDADWYTVLGGDGMVSHVPADSGWLFYGDWQFGSIERLDTDTWHYDWIQPQAEDAGVESGYDFRFGWTAPFIVSHFDPAVLYLGGNYLFKLTNRGTDWRIIGPDMTRQSRLHPEPITGHTSYGALFSIAESPVDRNTLWAGSDDGLLWLTTDGGASWQNLTDHIPDQAPRDCFVNKIDASRHTAGTAFVAYDCHRRDDYHPYLYRTTDGGKTFVNISGDLPADAGSYVVRQDPASPDVLYAGDERGVWITNDGGAHWVRLPGLPTVPVRDIEFGPGARDLVIPTFGRSIYILDGATTLHELTQATLAEPAHLFPVDSARTFETRDTYASFGTDVFTADNPPNGAIIDYYLQADAGHDVKLSIRRLSADTTAQPAGAGEPGGAADTASAPVAAADTTASAGVSDVVRTLTESGRPGLHRVIWDLRSSEPEPHRLGGPESPEEARVVPPGSYSVTLEVGGRTLVRRFEVLKGWIEHVPGRVR